MIDDDSAVEEVLGIHREYDIVVANIIAEILADLTPQIPRFIKRGGIFITSGILESKENIVTGAMEANGFRILEITKQGEWSSIAGEKI